MARWMAGPLTAEDASHRVVKGEYGARILDPRDKRVHSYRARCRIDPEEPGDGGRILSFTRRFRRDEQDLAVAFHARLKQAAAESSPFNASGEPATSADAPLARTRPSGITVEEAIAEYCG